MATGHHRKEVTRTHEADTRDNNLNRDNPETTRTVHESVVSDEAAGDTAPSSFIVARIIRFIGGAIMLLLALRFVLALLGANRANPFASFIFDLSAVFVWPFFGLFAYEPTYGVSQLELGTLVAIIIYGALAFGLAKLFTLTRR